MEKFYLEEPSLERKDEAREYIEEHLKYNSLIAGDSNLEEQYLNYESWLEYLDSLKSTDTAPDGKCPGKVFFLVRVSDNKLIGMINIRWNLNDWMNTYGGHIGYGIRPTERGKGYNKINLYLGLIEARKLGLDEVMLSIDDPNTPSIKTTLALGGILKDKVPSYDSDCLMGRYYINVEDSLNKYSNIYEEYIEKR